MRYCFYQKYFTHRIRRNKNFNSFYFIAYFSSSGIDYFLTFDPIYHLDFFENEIEFDYLAITMHCEEMPYTTIMDMIIQNQAQTIQNQAQTINKFQHLYGFNFLLKLNLILKMLAKRIKSLWA